MRRLAGPGIDIGRARAFASASKGAQSEDVCRMMMLCGLLDDTEGVLDAAIASAKKEGGEGYSKMVRDRQNLFVLTKKNHSDTVLVRTGLARRASASFPSPRTWCGGAKLGHARLNVFSVKGGKIALFEGAR